MEYQIKRIIFSILISVVILGLSIMFLPFVLGIFILLPALNWFKRSQFPKTKPKGTVEILPPENEEENDIRNTLDRDKKSGKKDKFRDL